MLQLIYVSRATPEVRQVDVKAILTTSIERNAREDITGLLVFDGIWFMQALEGPAEAIVALFERIRRDWRNQNVGIVSQQPIEERAFGSWAMAWNPVEPTGVGEPVEDIVAALVARVADPEIRAAFTKFCGLIERAESLTQSSRKPR